MHMSHLSSLPTLPGFLSLFFVSFSAASHGMWGLSSLTRARTHTPCSGR